MAMQKKIAVRSGLTLLCNTPVEFRGHSVCYASHSPKPILPVLNFNSDIHIKQQLEL